MSYFKGSRQRKAKKRTHSVSRDESISSKNESTDLQAATGSQSLADRRIQRKRSQAIDNTTEKEQAKKPKRSKPQTSNCESFVASSDHGETANKNVRKTGDDSQQAKKPKRSKSQTSNSKSFAASSNRSKKANKNIRKTSDDSPASLIMTGNKSNKTASLSSSDSGGNLHLSDVSDSLTLSDGGELHEQSDREFLQQQIKILKIPFQLETDCPSLSRIKGNDKKHIPLQVIHNALRKVNHKTEEEILRSLNRLAQRRLLHSLHASRPESNTNAVSHEQLERQKEVEIRVVDLEKAHHKITQEHAQYKCIGILVSQLEAVSEEFNHKTLMDEIQKTNEFVVSSSTVTKRKEKSSDNHAGAWPGVDAGDNIPSTHEQLVLTLFKD